MTFRDTVEMNIRLNWADLVTEAINRRKNLRLTPEQLAALAWISRPALYAFEQGKTNLILSSVLKILRCLGLD